MNIIGHERQQAMLLSHLRNDAYSHAYLFSGPKGIGKTAIARMFVSGILCKKRQAKSLAGCGVCEDCTAYLYGTHRNVLRFDTDDSEHTDIEKNGIISIGDVRFLRARTSMTSLGGETRICIVEDASRLTGEAANALLKIIEEPPPHTVFVLISHDEARLLPTILSRVWRIRFWPVSTELVKEYLVSEYHVASREADMRVLVAGGRPADAVRGLKETRAVIEKDAKRIEDIVHALETEDKGYLLRLTASYEEREEYRMLVDELIASIGPAYMRVINGETPNDMRITAYTRFAKLAKELLMAKEELPMLYLNPRLVFESHILSVA